MCNPTIKNAIFGGLIKTAIAKNNPRDGGGSGISPLISPVGAALTAKRKKATPTAAMPIVSSMSPATTPLGG